DLTLEAGAAHLILHHRVRLAEDIEPLFRHLAEDTNREPGAREWLAPDDLRRQAQQLADPSDFVLEELAQRLHEGEVHVGRQSADIVVRLDRGRGTLER